MERYASAMQLILFTTQFFLMDGYFTNSGRRRLNIFGAVGINELDIMTRNYLTINQYYTCDFFKHLRAKNPNNEKLILILDQGLSNKALSVKNLAKVKY
jgi:hypothetical protein